MSCRLTQVEPASPEVMDEYLTKPLRLKMLAAALDRWTPDAPPHADSTLTVTSTQPNVGASRLTEFDVQAPETRPRSRPM